MVRDVYFVNYSMFPLIFTEPANPSAPLNLTEGETVIEKDQISIIIHWLTFLYSLGFAHLNGIFSLASLEEIGKLWK